jgi:hypothetical protein
MIESPFLGLGKNETKIYGTPANAENPDVLYASE